MRKARSKAVPLDIDFEPESGISDRIGIRHLI